MLNKCKWPKFQVNVGIDDKIPNLVCCQTGAEQNYVKFPQLPWYRNNEQKHTEAENIT